MTAKIIILLSLFFLEACHQGPYSLKSGTDAPEPASVAECRRLIEVTERSIATASVMDTQDARIQKFPYLRVDRFLSSFRTEVQDRSFTSWVRLLQNRGLTGWKIELNNLPRHYKTELLRQTAGFFPEMPSVLSKLSDCSNTLNRFELNQTVNRLELKQNAIVPSEYNTWQQILGLYPITAIAFRLGIYDWHLETLDTFRKPLSSLPVEGELLRYSPDGTGQKLNRENVAAILRKSSDNPLRIPLPSELEQQKLFESFAPIFEIDRVSENDEIGAPYWLSHNTISIKTEKPMVYRHLSHTRIDSKILLQLNYIVWFTSRPKTWKLDLLGGHLDGIIWRVTLDPNGNPMLFDSIHPCGCYHFFFPTQHARFHPSLALYQEPAFAPQHRFIFDSEQSVIIRIGANDHYIQRIYSALPTGKSVRPYRLAKADSLRSLLLPNGQYRSLYNQDGIVSGSERTERYLFWPMGIPNPGAMRQWGHHATAFVGRRHFDDARLLEDVIKPLVP
ncbi:MAG: hypothetical protein ACU83N_08880 [Gammaproteobacteria bacterium]